MVYSKGDFLIRIKNAYMANNLEVDLPYSKENISIGKILIEKGLIKKLEEKKEGSIKKIIVQLQYKNRKPMITNIKLISKPSVHIYRKKKDIRSHEKYGLTILSTSGGIMSADDAKKKGFGGEVICQIF